MAFQTRVIEVTFPDGETDGSYIVWEVNGDGVKGRQLTPARGWFSLAAAGGVVLEVPSDIDDTAVATVQFQEAMFPGDDTPGWRPAENTAGEVLNITVDAAAKANGKTIDADVFPVSALKLVCLAADGETVVAPGNGGDVVFRLAAKG